MKKVSLFINTYTSKKLPDLHTAPTEKKTSIEKFCKKYPEKAKCNDEWGKRYLLKIF